jgi:hypothetical protein
MPAKTTAKRRRINTTTSSLSEWSPPRSYTPEGSGQNRMHIRAMSHGGVEQSRRPEREAQGLPDIQQDIREQGSEAQDDVRGPSGDGHRPEDDLAPIGSGGMQNDEAQDAAGGDSDDGIQPVSDTTDPGLPGGTSTGVSERDRSLPQANVSIKLEPRETSEATGRHDSAQLESGARLSTSASAFESMRQNQRKRITSALSKLSTRLDRSTRSQLRQNRLLELTAMQREFDMVISDVDDGLIDDSLPQDRCTWIKTRVTEFEQELRQQQTHQTNLTASTRGTSEHYWKPDSLEEALREVKSIRKEVERFIEWELPEIKTEESQQVHCDDGVIEIDSD